MSLFAKLDRVRVKSGIDRDHYGTVISVGGDDGTYYGVKLDCAPNPMGYSEYELDAARSRPTRPLWQFEGRHDTRGVYIPKEVAECPECGSELIARAMEHDEETGQPTATGIEMDCVRDAESMSHRYFQSDWQPVRDSIAKWCSASR